MSTLLQDLVLISEARYHQSPERRFWKFVHAANWTSDHDYNRIQDMLERIGKANALELYNVYNELSKKLSDHLWDPIRGVSDDGFSDLVAHTIGSGEQVYYAVMKDWNVAQKMVNKYQYQEGFQYIWHVLYDRGWLKSRW